MIELNGRLSLSLSTFVIIVAALTTAIVEVVFLSTAPRRTLRIISQIPFRLRSYNPILEMIIPDTLPPGDVASGPLGRLHFIYNSRGMFNVQSM